MSTKECRFLSPPSPGLRPDGARAALERQLALAEDEARNAPVEQWQIAAARRASAIRNLLAGLTPALPRLEASFCAPTGGDRQGAGL